MRRKTTHSGEHSLRAIVLGFLLTTVVGGYLVHYLESKRAHRAVVELRRTEATDFLGDISQMMDTRLYLWRRVAWAVEDGVTPGAENQRYAKYKQELFRWQYNINRNRAMLCRFFGPEARREFDSVQKEFAMLQDSLRMRRALSRENPARVTKSLNQLADPINAQIPSLASHLAEILRTEDFEAAAHSRPCSE